MAETRGLVQRIKLVEGLEEIYWVEIGPSPTNTTLFGLVFVDADKPSIHWQSSICEALTGALFARREVIVTHSANASGILGLEVVPG